MIAGSRAPEVEQAEEAHEEVDYANMDDEGEDPYGYSDLAQLAPQEASVITINDQPQAAPEDKDGRQIDCNHNIEVLKIRFAR